MLYSRESQSPKSAMWKLSENRTAWSIDVAAKTRNAGYFLSERRVSQESSIRKKYEDMVVEKKPVYLFSGFLRGNKAKAAQALGIDRSTLWRKLSAMGLTDKDDEKK